MYSKALKIGYRMGLDAAKREAELCRLSWEGEARAAAGAISAQIDTLTIPEDEIRYAIDTRNEAEWN